MPDFVAGTVWKTLALGALLGLIGVLLWTPGFGYSIAVGAALAAGNFAAIGWLAKKAILEGDHDGSSRQVNKWVALLCVKMGLLLALAFLAVWFLGVSPIGLSIGYTAFVVAIGGEAYVHHTS